MATRVIRCSNLSGKGGGDVNLSTFGTDVQPEFQHPTGSYNLAVTNVVPFEYPANTQRPNNVDTTSLQHIVHILI